MVDPDRDGDGVPDCEDECPDDPTSFEVGYCGCGVPDIDSDGDFLPDCDDGCPNDPNKTEPGACGCGVSEFDIDGNGTLDCVQINTDDVIIPAPVGCFSFSLVSIAGLIAPLVLHGVRDRRTRRHIGR